MFTKPRFYTVFTHIVLGVAILLGHSSAHAQTTISQTTSGTFNNLHYQFWKDSGDASMTLLEEGGYQSSWNQSTHNWLGGLGIAPVTPAVIDYSGTFTPDDGTVAYLAVFGWSTNPQFEYYVVESYSSWNPSSGGTYYGSYISDGVAYNAYYRRETSSGINSPWRITFVSVRQENLKPGMVNGRITVDNHLNAWKQMGVDLSSLEFLVLATEGYNGSGSSNISLDTAYGCGFNGHVHTCCSTALNNNGSGSGKYFDGTSCLVRESSEGWHPANPNDVIAAINVGGLLNAVQVNDIWYSPNTYVSGGIARGSLKQITATDENALYQSAQQGEISITIPVERKFAASIELGFANLAGGPVGQDLFDVIIEGKTVISGMDLTAEVGYNSAWKPEPIITTVSDGSLNILIRPRLGKATLSSVLVKEVTLEPQQITANASGFYADKFYFYWGDNQDADANLTLLDNRSFSTDWSANIGAWVGGFGWNPGGEKSINYSGQFNPQENGDAYFGLHGWTSNPMVPFYIIESYVGNIPGFAGTKERLGEYLSDGALYDLYKVRLLPESIQATLTFPSYYSIRRQNKPIGAISGTINTASHFKSWAQLGVTLGTFDYMILATEASENAGNAQINFDESPLSCGEKDGTAVCCDIADDSDGDGYGELFNGEMCIVAEGSKGWHPPNPDYVVAALNIGADADPILEDGIWYRKKTDAECNSFIYMKNSAAQSGNEIHKSGCAGKTSITIENIESEYVSVQLGLFEEQSFNNDYAPRFDVVTNGAGGLYNVNIHAHVEPLSLWKTTPFVVKVYGGSLRISVLSDSQKVILSSVLVTKAEAPLSSSSSNSNSSSPSQENPKAGSVNYVTLIILLLGLMVCSRRQHHYFT